MRTFPAALILYDTIIPSAKRSVNAETTVLAQYANKTTIICSNSAAFIL